MWNARSDTDPRVLHPAAMRNSRHQTHAFLFSQEKLTIHNPEDPPECQAA